jgi:hypothetical protein
VINLHLYNHVIGWVLAVQFKIEVDSARLNHRVAGFARDIEVKESFLD